MEIIALDLSGPSNVADTALTHLRVSEDGETDLVDVELGVSDEAVRRRVNGVDGAVVLGMDAPLSYAPGGGLREMDRALRDALAARGFERNYVMAPTMTRMVYLTVRGMTIARFFSNTESIRIMEVHPIAALLWRGIREADARQLKDSAESRERVAARIRESMVSDLPISAADSDHVICSAAAAVAARDAADGVAGWRYDDESPHHPFPLVC